MKSQLKNKDKALRVLRSRLYEMGLPSSMTLRQRQEARDQVQVTAPRRSVPTFLRDVPTDHRIKLTLHRLENILNGDLDEGLLTV